MFVSFLLCLLLSACSGIPIDVTGDQNTLDILNKAINELDRQPEAWKNVLDDTIKKLGDKTTEVAKELQDLYEDSLAFTRIEISCEADFFGQRVKKSLEYIRDNLVQQTNLSPPSPWVCNPHQGSVDLIRDASGHFSAKYASTDPERLIVRVDGFNFRSLDLPTVELQDTNHNTVRPSKAVVNFLSSYLIAVNFQSEDFAGVSEEFSFALKWPDSADTPQIPISIENAPPPPPSPQMITKLVLIFHTLDDDKDDSATIHVEIYASDLVFSGEFGRRQTWHDHTDQRFELSLARQVRFDQVSTMEIKIVQTDDDTGWNMSYEIQAVLDDGTTHLVAVSKRHEIGDGNELIVGPEPFSV